MKRVHISGDGRMGHSLIRLLKDLSAVGTIAEADVVIDFSHPDWTGPLVGRLLAEPPRTGRRHDRPESGDPGEDSAAV